MTIVHHEPTSLDQSLEDLSSDRTFHTSDYDVNALVTS